MHRQSRMDLAHAKFEVMRPDLYRTHPGAYAVLYGEELVGVFATQHEAFMAGVKRTAPTRDPFLLAPIEEKAVTVHLL